MTETGQPPQKGGRHAGDTAELETTARRVGQVVVGLALLLWLAGLGVTLSPYGDGLGNQPVVPLRRLGSVSGANLALWLMSVGIAVLCLEPFLRVAWSAVYYVRRRRLANIAIALGLLAELLISALLVP